MSNQVSNTAKQMVEAEELEVDEPSMEEILASIKQIISDDEEAAALQDREQYTHPADHSNSNRAEDDTDASIMSDLEADLEAGIQVELEGVSNTDQASAEAETDAKPEAETKSETTPAPAPEATVETAPSPAPEAAEPPENKLDITVPDQDDAAPPTGQTMQDRAEQIRNELSDASAGLSVSDRLEKYRVRGKLKMETLAGKKPEAMPEPVVKQPAVSPAVAAGPVLPTTDSIAQKMAQTMLDEKEEEIQVLLANIMRPTIRKWLSDNLPTMVEKLVREEIERVSRGKQGS